ncbi:MAG: DUF3240 family protein [Pseudohongiellaceae bacterium]|nr:DUF3240 family protein [Pseudohongiellaceae bacterium]
MTKHDVSKSEGPRTMLVLNVAPALAEDLIDYLLRIDGVDGFTSYHVHGHGEHGGLTVAEQVSGRRKREQFEILIAEPLIPTVIAGLAENVGRDIVYWEQNIAKLGRIT